MSYPSKAGSTDKISRNNHLYREWQEQQENEEQADKTAEQTEPERLGGVFNQLDRYTVDGPGQHATAALLAIAASYAIPPEQAQAVAAVPSQKRLARLDERSGQPQPVVAFSLPLRLLQAMVVQARTLHRLFWLISALFVGAGAAIEWLAVSKGFTFPAMPDLFLSTVLLLTVASVAYSLRSMHTPMSELEATFPVTPVQLMVSRVGSILLYDLLLAFLFNGILVLTDTSGVYNINIAIGMIDLLLPICLSTLAALAAMLRFGTWPGTAIVLTVGILQFVAGDRLGVFHLFKEYGSAQWFASKLIAVVLAIALGGCTSLLVRQRHYYKHQE